MTKTTDEPQFLRIQAGRAMGKTTMMLQEIGRLQDEFELCVVITSTSSQARRIADLIVSDFWDWEIDPERVIVQSVTALSNLRGRLGSPLDTAVLIDDWDLMRHQDRSEILRWPWSIKVVTETV